MSGMALLEDLTTVAVVGAGAMGTGIAQVAAHAGHQVHLVDAEPGGAAAAHRRLGDTLRRLVDKDRMSADERAGILDRIVIGPAADGDLAQLPPVGLAIEAVVEDLAIKQEILQTLADQQDESTVLATNTSSLDVGALSHDLASPQRLIGLHFFNPPPLMRLVEVVRTTQSDPEILEQASTLMTRWGKTPVLCTSTPGFIVNRVARPFYGEAQRMIQDGTADPATIDLALRERGGFRMGPCELTDLIGQDINLAVGRSVWLQTGRDPRYEPAEVQHELVEAGRLGRKSGRGWFAYDDSGRPLDATPDEGRVSELVGGRIETDPVARTLAMLVNEGVDLVRRGEASAQDVDTAMRLGTNYPKGPHEWLAEIGAATIVEQLRALDAAFPGGRYRVSSALADRA